ncbi:hypothetical protein ACO0LQ_000332 [Salmonella enterica]|nr:hypothetical protein [Salmonella enterica subsp. enterica]EDN7239625.1 hypothetical protein [Salmonella enterica subsp. enterica serovar Thompson]EGI6309531.1 hypothetical protein [Salmonella enterica subsp. enterica serovar Brazzaville]EHI5877720.1 hypothetical protein [Salmonella enterica]ECG1259920.1 hypothetical protein [Salmonella enterica subsp. enterica]
MDTSLLSNYQQNSWDKPDLENFKREIAILEGEINSAMATLNLKAHLRSEYIKATNLIAKELFLGASRGMITWGQAAQEASSTRNTIMDLIRSRSSPVGKALAQSLKIQGKTLNELIARYAIKLYGENVDFNHLSTSQQDQVYAEIVKASGRQRPAANKLAVRFSRAGRILIFISLAISIYLIYEEEDPLYELERQIVIGVAGIEGGWAGGSLAGLMCGPGAPVCVLIGVFVGGAIAAYVADWYIE